ncbi:MAG: hypothetical protein Q9174_001380 [Haloplaca sp. 1 TL-2023]
MDGKSDTESPVNHDGDLLLVEKSIAEQNTKQEIQWESGRLLHEESEGSSLKIGEHSSFIFLLRPTTFISSSGTHSRPSNMNSPTLSYATTMVASYDPSSVSEDEIRTPSFSSSASAVFIYDPRSADFPRSNAESDGDLDANGSDETSSVLSFTDERSFVMSRTADWAEQQSSESSGLNYAPVFRVRTSGPSLPCSVAYTGAKENAELQVSTEPSSSEPDPGSVPSGRANPMIRYSIATLFSLSHLALPASHKYDTPQDVTLAGLRKLTQTDAPPQKQENIRPRSHTTSSNAGILSTFDTDEGAHYPASYIRPIRQPIQPPDSLLAQKHLGFIDFLKTHSSPPHHRVTAGGRIVPAGPQSPPPMMLLPSINTVMGNSSMQAYSHGQSNVPGSSTKALNNSKTPFPPSNGPLASQNINSNAQKAFEVPNHSSRPNRPNATSQIAQMQTPSTNAFGERLGHLPLGATPLVPLNDGSHLVQYNGMFYQTSWDGHRTVLNPLPAPYSGPMQTGYGTMGYPLPPIAPQYNAPYGSSGLGYHLDPMASLHNANGPTYPQWPFNQPGMAQPENPRGLHDSLAAELTNLDKHVALHLHEFSVAENEFHTFRRRQLVEQLDHLRVSKETVQGSQRGRVPTHNGNAVNFMSNTQDLNRGSNNTHSTAARPLNKWNSSFIPHAEKPTTKQFPVAGPSVRLAATATPINKSLSPDAAPFVPSGTKPATLENRYGYQLQGSRTQFQPNQSATKAAQSSLTFPGCNRDDKWYEDFGTEIPSSTAVSSAIPALSESHVAESLPVVTEYEIAYAEDLNPKDGPKSYCDTIEEFQEVIRRVREQAQMYGCKGGQSKDPAYDAEQDIRWAIADCDRIRLPGSPADHVAHPRPWDWDDSAFNNFRSIDYFNRPTTLGRGEESPYGLEGLIPFTGPHPWEGPDTPDRAGTRSPWVRSPYLPLGPNSPPLDYEGVYKKFRAPYTGLTWEEHCAQEDKISGSQVASIISQAMGGLPQGRSSAEDAPTSPFKSFQQAGHGGNGAKYDSKDGKGQQKGSRASGHDDPIPNGPSIKRDVSGLIDKKERAMQDGRAWAFRDGASRLVSHDSDKSWTARSQKPRVNLPSATSHYAAFDKPNNVMQQRANSTQTAVNFAKIPSDESSHGFLRGMLKSPRYSVARIHQSDPYHTMPSHSQATTRVENSPARRQMNKENIRSEGYDDASCRYGRGLGMSQYNSRNAYQSEDSSFFSSKARSSLAASNYHATGRLPQYDGAGEEALGSSSSQLGSSMQRNNNMQAAHGRKAGPTARSAHIEPSSRFEQAQLYDVGPTNNYDYRGITKKAFATVADPPDDLGAHYHEVGRYFDRLRAEEQLDIATGLGPDVPSYNRL